MKNRQCHDMGDLVKENKDLQATVGFDCMYILIY